MNLVDPSSGAAVTPLSVYVANSGGGPWSRAVNAWPEQNGSELHGQSPGRVVHGGKAASASQSRSVARHRAAAASSAAVEDLGPPPTFTEEDMRLYEASVAEKRAKKAAARAAKGRIPLNASAAAVVPRADENAHGRSSSAAVEDLGPPPTFTDEDMRLHEASVAEKRAKKAAARAAKGRIPLNTSGRRVQGGSAAAASESRLAQA